MPIIRKYILPSIYIDVSVGLELNQQRDTRTTGGKRKNPPLAITQYNNKDCLIYSLFMYTSREGEKKMEINCDRPAQYDNVV